MAVEVSGPGSSPINLTSISQYISYLKRVGIATNNLYVVRFNLQDYVRNDLPFTNTQQDNPQSSGTFNSISNVLSGTVNLRQIQQKAKSIFNNTKSIYEDITNIFSGRSASDPDKAQEIPTDFSNIEGVEILCTSAQIPFYKQKMGTSFINHMNRKFVVGTDTDHVKMTFYVDRSNNVMKFFTTWHNKIYKKTGYSGVMNYKNDYACIIEIYMINKNTSGLGVDVQCGGVLMGAYPAFIEPINLNNNNTELVELNVTFEYDMVGHIVYPYQGEELKLGSGLFNTGLNIIDMKNKVEQTINSARDMGRITQNTIKNTRHTVVDMKNTAKRIFRF